MRSGVFSFLLFFFSYLEVQAQYQISGKVLTLDKNKVVEGCVVYLNDNVSIITDAQGDFFFKDLKNGTYTLQTQCLDFKPYSREITILNKDERVIILLHKRTALLKEVTVTEKGNEFGHTRMRAVENMGIYEGKKTEVVIPEQLVANLATNNARQVYARVAGLNIWENDGAGIQLSIGGRGLDPNRSSNFNVKQNGYDISADALGYPESYYTPPVEAVEKIQIVRGAASLQYGTQFGGLLNFVMKKAPEDKKLELLLRQSFGSFGFYNAFTSAGGTVGKLSYYTFFQYKSGNGWRNNSEFKNYTAFARLNYKFTENTSIGFDLTHMNYLAKQPGGLSDEMFINDPRQTNRSRNWFQVNWNLAALHFDHKFNATSEFNLRVFGLYANRYSLGFRPNRVATVDDNNERDLIKGDFENWGLEARYLKRYQLFGRQAVVLAGLRYYSGFNHSLQGLGTKGSDADFSFVEPERLITYDYRFPNKNTAVFVESIIYLGSRFSITPGIRAEYINTEANGYYGAISRDLAGNIINVSQYAEHRKNTRQFILGGIGLSYKPLSKLDIYANVSQNYRSITFSDMRISNPSSLIDPELKDERGYNADLGVRGGVGQWLNYDVGVFYLNYNNRIGEIQFADASNRILRLRTNIGQAFVKGVEAYAETDVLGLAGSKNENFTSALFVNMAYLQSEYKYSEAPGVSGKEVEFVPAVNLKSGLRLSYKKLKASFQYTYLSDQYSDATNAIQGGISSVVGLIPAYTVMDAGISYEYKRYKLELNVNNLSDVVYFTRRATGYPGPGILPSDGRSFYLSLQARF